MGKLYLVPPTLPGWDVAESGIVTLAAATGVEHVVRISALGTQPDADSMSLASIGRASARSSARGWPTRTSGRTRSSRTRCTTRRRSGATMRSTRASERCGSPSSTPADIGEVVATVLTSAGHEGRAYTLTGPEALSYDDLAEIMSGVWTGASATSISPSTVRRALAARRVPRLAGRRVRGHLWQGLRRPDDRRGGDRHRRGAARPPATHVRAVRRDHREQFV